MAASKVASQMTMPTWRAVRAVFQGWSEKWSRSSVVLATVSASSAWCDASRITAMTPATPCAAKNAIIVASESTVKRARRRSTRHASKAKKARATRPAAVDAVTKKSNGEARNGRINGDAYSAAEKIGASDQSAGEAMRNRYRPATMAVASAARARTYRDSGFEV